MNTLGTFHKNISSRRLVNCNYFIFPTLLLLFSFTPCFAAMPSLNFTVNMSENVIVNTTGGTPTIALTVDDKPRFASYASGTGTNTLTFTYAPTVGDVDLDGITITSPYNIILNSGTIKDAAGNNASLSFTPPVTTGVKVNYPSLSMDFIADADGRYTLNGNPHDTLPAFLSDASGSFTRASIGTYFDSTGTLQTATSNTPRFDYDPVTHAAKGILIEEARINLLTQSDDIFTYTGTQASTTTLDNVALAPDGTMKADSISSSGGGWRGKNYTFATSTTYTFSLWVWVPSGTKNFQLNLFNGASNQTSAVMTATTTPTRYIHTVTTTSGGAGNVVIYPPAGSSTFYVWGWQLEQGAFPTSYIPTTTASVTRVADNLTIPTGGWFLTSEGTYFSQWNKYGGNNTRILSFDNPTDTPIAHNASNQFQLFGAINITTGTAPLNSINKGGSTYKTSVGTSLSGNGSAAATNASLLATPTLLRVAPASGTNYFNGWIQKVKYYPLRASDSQLQLLTQ